MKNKYFDAKRMLAKQYAKTWRRAKEADEDGIVLYHMYSDEHKKTEGWWDDVAFRLGSQIVIVWWIHPRMAYKDECSNITHELVPSPDTIGDWLEGGTKNYKYLGRNKKRKRLVSTTMGPVSSASRDWFSEFDLMEKKVLSESDVVIRPSMKIQQLDWARGVSLCMPVEAIDKESVTDMAKTARSLIRGETTLTELFGDYTYTRDNWNEESKGWDKKYD